MSPNEDALRAALRDGEPDGTAGADGLSADRLIARANDVRRRRRLRYGSVLGGVAAAAVAGVLIASLGASTRSSSEKRSAGGAAGSVSDQRGNAPVAGRGATVASGHEVSCPAAAPEPGTGTGHGSLFTGPVASITLCLYAESGGAPVRASNGQVLTSTVSGTPAQQLATSLDAAGTQPLAQPCPQFRLATGKLLAMIPVGSDGAAMAPIIAVVQDNPCNQPVTNGTAVRYNWTAPSVLGPYLHQAAALTTTPAGPAPGSSVPVEHGSPIRT